MTTCTEKALLGDYLDRELSPAEKKRVESHLGECPGCRAELDELKSLSNMVAGLPQAALPVGFMQRLERRRQGGGAVARSARPWHLPVGARLAAFAAASLLVTFVVYDRVRTTMPAMMFSGAAGSLGTVSEDEMRLSVPNSSPFKAGKGGAHALAFGAGGSAASSLGSSAPAAPRVFAAKKARAPGAPIEFKEEAADAKRAQAEAAAGAQVTNEALQKDLARQERQLGVRTVVPAQRYPMGQMASTGGQYDQLSAVPQAAPIGGGSVANLLEQPQNVPALAAMRGAAAEPPPPASAFEGVVVRSAQERAALWTSHHMNAAPPRVDYARKMLVVVFGPMDSGIEIDGVKAGLEKTVIQYRQFPLPEGASRKTNAPPYQFRAINKTDNPVVFQLLQ